MQNENTDPRFTRPGFSGQNVPFFGLKFDKNGKSQSPVTQKVVLDLIQTGGYTDTIVFSHGWNNEWDDAVNLYTRFLDGIGAFSTEHANLLSPDIKPLMIGISWPSAAFTWPWDKAPNIASGEPDHSGKRLPNQLDEVDVLTEGMSVDAATELRALLDGKESLTSKEVNKLAELLAPTIGGGQVDEFEPQKVTARELSQMLKVDELTVKPPQIEEDEEGDGFTQGGMIGDEVDDAEAAGIFSDVFGIRKVLRLATVRKMKDRAGTVGRGDVSGLISQIVSDTQTRLHLVGHSYGAKVVLSAAVKATLPRPITSALLLQSAINHLAFAKDIGDGRIGGFRMALGKVEKPILATHSKDDFPLRSIFHLAVRRDKDIGEEPGFASGKGLYSAMGGYGPSELAAGELLEIIMPAKGRAYPSSGGVEVISLDASEKIGGHSEITNDYTFWAMLENLR